MPVKITGYEPKRDASAPSARRGATCRRARRRASALDDGGGRPQPPLPTPGQRVSGIDFPQEYRLPGKPDDRRRRPSQDAYRQTQFVLGEDLRLFAEGMDLQLRILNDSSHSRYRTHVYAAVVGTWSRAYSALADACLLVTRGSYASVPNLVRSACELIAAEHQVQARGDGRVHRLDARRTCKPDEEHKAFDVGLGHYFAGSTLAADELLRSVYRAASDLGRPNFGATLLRGRAGVEQRAARLHASPTRRSTSAGPRSSWAGCCASASASSPSPCTCPTSSTSRPRRTPPYADYAPARAGRRFDNPNRARIEEVEEDGFKRWLVHNFRRQPSGAPKKMLSDDAR